MLQKGMQHVTPFGATKGTKKYRPDFVNRARDSHLAQNLAAGNKKKQSMRPDG